MYCLVKGNDPKNCMILQYPGSSEIIKKHNYKEMVPFQKQFGGHIKYIDEKNRVKW